MTQAASLQQNLRYTRALAAQRNLDADMRLVYARLAQKWNEAIKCDVCTGTLIVCLPSTCPKLRGL